MACRIGGMLPPVLIMLITCEVYPLLGEKAHYEREDPPTASAGLGPAASVPLPAVAKLQMPSYT